MTTSSSPHASGYALLIGVETYDGLSPDKQLHAGRNDVLAFYKVCRRLGMPPENISLLTSPVLDKQQVAQAELELSRETNPAKPPTNKAAINSRHTIAVQRRQATRPAVLRIAK